MESKTDRKYMFDQYFKFVSDGATTLKGNNLKKRYYKLSIPVISNSNDISNAGGRVFVDFKKHIYVLENPISCDQPAVLIHYLGDEKVYVPHPHGNSAQDRPYTRTSEDTIQKIKQQVSCPLSKPKSIYGNLVKEAVKNRTADGNVFVREPINAPRNEKQVRNFKEQATRERKINHCEIFSIYEMAKNDLGNFILNVTLIPNDIVIVAEPSILTLTNEVINAANKQDDLAQLMCYDTTFNLGDIYVSILVARNVFVAGDPIFPVAFMLHDRKLESVHEEFWNTMKKYLDLDVLCENVPICTDRESSITNAIRKIIPGVNLIFCNNHLKRDVKTWIQSASGKTSTDTHLLGGQIAILLQSDSQAEFLELFEKYKFKWSLEYVHYIESNIQNDLMSSAKYSVCKFAAFKECLPTNNISESMNFVIKHANNWKEFPIDTLVLQFLELQCNQMNEFSRATRGLGKYYLKKQFKNMIAPQLPSYIPFSNTEMIQMFKIDADPTIEKDCTESKELLAQKCVNMGLVALVPNLQMFVVRSPFTGQMYNVERVSAKQSNSESGFKCNCNSPYTCYHRMAVMMSIGEPTQQKARKLQLNWLKKKTRGHKLRCGRKKPNSIDLNDQIKEAPDSQCAEQKRKCEERYSSNDSLINFKSVPRKKYRQNSDKNKVKKSALCLTKRKEFDFPTAPLNAPDTYPEQLRNNLNTDFEKKPDDQDSKITSRSQDNALNSLLNLEIPEVIENESALIAGKASSLRKCEWLDGDIIDTLISYFVEDSGLKNILYISWAIYNLTVSNS